MFPDKLCFLILFLCRLFGDQVRRAYDVAICFLHNHNVGLLYIKRDADPHAKIYWLALFLFQFRRCTTVQAT